MSYIPAVEVRDSDDHVGKLHGNKMQSKLMLDYGSTLELANCDRFASARFSKYSVMFPAGIQGVTIAGTPL